MVKMKLAALWLNATGVGLFAVFNNTIDTLSILTGLGIRQSAVREVSAASGDVSKLRPLLLRIRGWSCLSGLLGGALLSALAPLLSVWIFGDFGYWWQFMVLSGAMIMNSLVGGEQAILQGLSRFRRLAGAGVRTSLLGLLVSVPLLRYCGDTGVVLSIVVYSASGMLFYFLYRDRTVPYRVSWPRKGEGMASFVRLGGYIALAAFVSNLFQLLFVSWLSREASMEEVGYYQAGNALIVRYAGIVLTAVGMEFYPRLSASASSPRRLSLFVSHEIALLNLLFTPLLMLFLLFKGWIVALLYAPSFEVILPYISVGILSVLLRASSVALAYVILSKGDGRTYFIVETIDAIIGLILNIVFYEFRGLTGLGFAVVLWFLIYLVMVAFIYRFRYGLRLTRRASVIAFSCLLAAIAAVSLDFCLPRVFP